MSEFLLYICVSIISTFGFMYLFIKINNIISINKKSIFIFSFGVIFITLIHIFDLKVLNSISFFIFFPLLFSSMGKFGFKKTIVNIFVIYFVGIILDLLVMGGISIVCHFFHLGVYDFSVLTTLILFFVFVLLGHWKFMMNVLNKVIKFISEIQYSNFSLIIFCLCMFVFSWLLFTNLNKVNVDVLLLIIAFLCIILFILLLRFRINDVENQKYLATLKENNDFYIKMDNENRIFKHNLMAKLSSIKSVSNQKAIDLIDDFVIKMNKSTSYSSKIKDVPYGLNGIIYQNTYPYLEDIHFKISNHISFDIFEVLKPRRYNVLVEKLILCLDNAREASLNSADKIVVINLFDDEESIYIEIKNTFSDNLDIDSLGSQSYSTKGEKRGLGLFSSLRNNEVPLKVKVVNNYFVCTLIAKKQKK